MNSIKIIYIVFMLILFMIGTMLIRSSLSYHSRRSKKITFRHNRYKEISDDIHNRLSNSELDKQLFDAGVGLTAFSYNLLRLGFTVGVLVVGIMAVIRQGDDALKYIIIATAIYLATTPRIRFNHFTTPFGWALEAIKSEFEAKKDLEVYRAITQLKNLAIAQQAKPLGADFIISQLLKFTKVTKPIFSQTLSLWRLGKEKEAQNYFATAIGTKLGGEFANVLVKLDQINPVELVDQLLLYQTHVKEERVTKILDKQERRSNIIFIPVLALAFTILMNFVMIVVWLDSFNNITQM